MTIQTEPSARADEAPDAASTPRRLGRLSWLLIQTGTVLLAGGVWWFASTLFPPSTLPPPAEVIARLGELAITGGFWVAIAITLGTFALGLAICIVVGIPLGLAIGANPIGAGSTRLLFDFLRTIPPIAILPLLLLVFGAKFEMVLVLAVSGAIWPILIQSIYAARQGEALLAEMSRSYRIPRAWYIRHIFVPGAIPFVMTGVRLGTTICLLLTVSGELLGGAPGVGFEIANAQAFYDNTRMYAYVLVAAVLGLIVNGGFWAAQRRLLRWHPSVRREQHS
ncbi:MAG: ABC transporter permease [Actinomycetales bacterium]|nr:ABC transporter permease [Actinomycetales bacterium]